MTFHDFAWFFATGRFDPAWVQAVSSILVLVVTAATLIVLIIYAYDTRRLAKSSIEQIKATKQQLAIAEQMLKLSQEQFAEAMDERDSLELRNFHRAYAALLDVKLRIDNEAAEKGKPRITARHNVPPIRPSDWHEIAASIYERVPEADNIVISLGTCLQELDNAMVQYWDEVGPSQTEPEASRQLDIALADAKRDLQSLNKILNRA